MFKKKYKYGFLLNLEERLGVMDEWVSYDDWLYLLFVFRVCR